MNARDFHALDIRDPQETFRIDGTVFHWFDRLMLTTIQTGGVRETVSGRFVGVSRSLVDRRLLLHIVLDKGGIGLIPVSTILLVTHD